MHGIDRQAIAKLALRGQGQPLWSFMLPGSRGHIDFGEQFPYDPEKAKALLDPDTITRASDTRAGHNTISHDDARHLTHLSASSARLGEGIRACAQVYDPLRDHPVGQAVKEPWWPPVGA
jgi:Bacterial extracellular solute-binding proteins, family 5 Middle